MISGLDVCVVGHSSAAASAPPPPQCYVHMNSASLLAYALDVHVNHRFNWGVYLHVYHMCKQTWALFRCNANRCVGWGRACAPMHPTYLSEHLNSAYTHLYRRMQEMASIYICNCSIKVSNSLGIKYWWSCKTVGIVSSLPESGTMDRSWVIYLPHACHKWFSATPSRIRGSCGPNNGKVLGLHASLSLQ